MSRGKRQDAPTDPPEPQRPEARRRRPADEPFDVHVELVVLDGPAGEELARHQAAIMRKVLRWVRDHPTDLAAADPAGADDQQTDDGDA